MAVLAGGQESTLNGVTPVTILAAPAAATQRIVPANGIGLDNEDTAVITVTLKKLGGAVTPITLARKTLDVGDTFFYPKTIVLDGVGESLTMVLSGAIATTNPDVDVAYLDHSP